eukprot:8224841-Prorocentrum_lima.AAC.1
MGWRWTGELSRQENPRHQPRARDIMALLSSVLHSSWTWRSLPPPSVVWVGSGPDPAPHGHP